MSDVKEIMALLRAARRGCPNPEMLPCCSLCHCLIEAEEDIADAIRALDPEKIILATKEQKDE